MNILKQLSIKSLILNKKRTISTIIGIILSCSLICAVATMFTSFQETLIQEAIFDTGYYHIKLSNVSKDNIKELENNRDVKSMYTTEEVGYAKLENSKNEYKPYMHLYSMNKEVFENLKFKISVGRFPVNSDEIIISKHIINNAKVEFKVGDTITIDVGQRKSLDGYDLDVSNNYNETEEQIKDSQKHNFKIVGIIERPNYSFESRNDPGYTIITTNIGKGKNNVYLSLKSPRQYKTSVVELLGAKDYKEVEKRSGNLKYNDYSLNKELLRWEVAAFSDSTVNMLYSVIGVVIFIIIFTSVFCIRNSFAIAMTEKIKMYGMLSSVGATSKQIKKNVIFEGLILGVIGIPLGIISGIFAVFVLIQIVNVLIGDFINATNGIILKVSILPILISIILGIITIYLSAISSARKASKVSPIEQLRNSNDIKIKNKKLKVPKIISKLFKTGGVLAYKNLKRSKKKYRTTVMSIAISVFVFITMDVFITNAFDYSGNYYEDYDYNLILYGNLDNLSESELNKALSLDNINEHFMLYESKEDYIEIKDLSKINETEQNGLDYDEDSGQKMSRLQVVSLDNESFKKYAQKIGQDYEKVKDVGILIDDINYYDEEAKNTKKIRIYKYSRNDTITGTYNNKEINIKVGVITDIRPYGLEKTYYYGGYLIVDKNVYKDFKFNLDSIYINSENPDKLERDIKNLGNNISISNIDAEVKEQKSMVLVIKIFLYGFISVITLIGVTNIFNTITSNMELRQKEFAMLKSIGMTKREFNRMINLETIFYGTKSLIYGTILGLIGTFAIYKAFSVKIDSGMYIPIKPIFISAVFVFALVFIIMRYSIRKINKQNTIETIRKDNI